MLELVLLPTMRGYLALLSECGVDLGAEGLLLVKAGSYIMAIFEVSNKGGCQEVVKL